MDWYCEKCGGFIEKIAEVVNGPDLPSKSLVGMKVCPTCLHPVYRRSVTKVKT